MANPIVFYWDFTSPYAYIGANLIEAVAKKHNRSVDWRPVSLGHLWKAIPDRAPMGKGKMEYSMRDWTRSAEMAGLPIVTTPNPFPTDAKLPRLVFYHLKARDPAQGPSRAAAFAKAAFRQYWGEGRDIARPEHLAGLGATETEIAAAAEDTAARQQVLDATSDAGKANAFGTPTFIVDGEMFWGSDRIDQIDWWLAKKT